MSKDVGRHDPVSPLGVDLTGGVPRALITCPACSHSFKWAPPVYEIFTCPACQGSIELGKAATDFNEAVFGALARRMTGAPAGVITWLFTHEPEAL